MTADLHISKLDAARRQLESAVRFYFSEGDPVSIHTMTAAAHQILADISTARGDTQMFFESMIKTYVRPEGQEVYKKHIRAAANFFKHAGRDPDGIYTFNPRQTDFLLFEACHAHKELTGELVPLLAVYSCWFVLGPGANLIDPTGARIFEPMRLAFRGGTRGSFFREALPRVSQVQP